MKARIGPRRSTSALTSPVTARHGGTVYVTGRPLPSQIRAATFPLSRLGRRGYRLPEVHRFLEGLAGDLAALQDELAAVRTENERLKVYLREWQTRNSPARFYRSRS